MRKMWLIAVREYLAYVKTVGFWLSLLTVPIIILMSSVLPIFLIKADPQETVAVIDNTGLNLKADVETIIRDKNKKEALPPQIEKAAQSNPLIKAAIQKAMDGGVTLAPWPEGVDTGEQSVRDALKKNDFAITTALILSQKDGQLVAHIWHKPDIKSRLSRSLYEPLQALNLKVVAQGMGLDAEKSAHLSQAKLSLETQKADFEPNAAKNVDIDDGIKASAFLGAMLGYVTWIAVFSSSMLLLSSVIEEKANRVLEVILASTSVESLLGGKVLGVAMVLFTVVGLWVGVSISGMNAAAGLMPADAFGAMSGVLGNLFSLKNIALMLVYLVAGYLMYGLFFAVIGSFCETPKDAQSIIGPLMIILMIPMISLQVALVNPDAPFIRYLSFVPIFSPFLMPVRIATAPIWEVAMTIALMGLVMFILMRIGRRAFKQGALSSGKVTFKGFLGALRKTV